MKASVARNLTFPIHLHLVLFIVVSAEFPLTAQNRAPSCWLNYTDYQPGNILVNTILVVPPSPTYTYYCALAWNGGMEGGGYCGIQEHPDGRNFIYSIWDPIGSSDSIVAVYTGPGTMVENFGGEGTGLKSWNFSLGWETEEWYSFITRTWNVNDHTLFGFWVQRGSNNQWHHLVTMDYPVNNVRFNSGTGSFIEDWFGNGWMKREVKHSNGWKRTEGMSWLPFSQAWFSRVYPDPGAQNYIENYDGGVNPGNFYFMKSGGSSTTPVSNTSGTNLFLPTGSTSPVFSAGEIGTLAHNLQNDSLIVQWTINEFKSPQFSYSLSVYDNAGCIGNPILSSITVQPHIRSAGIDIQGLLSGTWYLKFYINDIFDNQSNIWIVPFEFSTTGQIMVSEISLPSFGNIYPGSVSVAQSYSIFGTGISDSVVVVAPPGFQLSTASQGPFFMRLAFQPVNGSITQTLFVQFNPDHSLPAVGTIVHSSNGVNSKTVSVRGNSYPSGLVAWYPFIDGSCQDMSGNQHHGTNYGSVAAGDRIGQIDQARSFDGNDYIWLGNPGELKSPHTTVAAWFQTLNSQSYQRIYRWRWYGVELGVALGELYCSIHTLNGSFSCYSSEIQSDGQWHFAAMSFDGSILKLYCDGQLMDSVSVPYPVYYSSEGAAIGRDGDYNGYYFNGSLDEVQIYNRALPVDEINQIIEKTVPELRTLQSIGLPSGQSVCFDGMNFITVAGNGTTFTGYYGSEVLFLAGTSIRFLPDVNIYSGGKMRACITIPENFCSSAAPLVEPFNRIIDPEESLQSALHTYSLVPNPVTGNKAHLTRTKGAGKTANRVMIHDFAGRVVSEVYLSESRITELILDNVLPGVYLVRIVGPLEHVTIKMIRL